MLCFLRLCLKRQTTTTKVYIKNRKMLTFWNRKLTYLQNMPNKHQHKKKIRFRFDPHPDSLGQSVCCEFITPCKAERLHLVLQYASIFVKYTCFCAAGWMKMQNLTMCHFTPRNLINDPWQTIIPALRKVYSTMSYHHGQQHHTEKKKIIFFLNCMLWLRFRFLKLKMYLYLECSPKSSLMSS